MFLTLAISDSMFSSTHTTTPFQDILVTLPSLNALLLVKTSCLHQGLLKNVYHLHPNQTCVPQTLWTSQATSDSQETMEFHLQDFIEKLSPSSSYTLILVIFDYLSKKSLFILTHNTVIPQQLAQLF